MWDQLEGGHILVALRACHHVGGSEALLKAANVSNTVIPLKLRPDCAEDHPVYGQLQKQRGLLVKVCKKKTGGSTTFSAEIVANVVGSYRFMGLADFQIAPDTGLQTPKTQVLLTKLIYILVEWRSYRKHHSISLLTPSGTVIVFAHSPVIGRPSRAFGQAKGKGLPTIACLHPLLAHQVFNNLQDSQRFEKQLGEKEEPLLAIPPMFTRNDEPIDYQFRSYYGNDPPNFRSTGMSLLAKLPS